MRVIILALAIFAFVPTAFTNPSKHEKPPVSKEEVSPNEDLMREHGVLKRLLFIYQEIARRIDNYESFPPQALTDSVKLVRDFLENYHEKLEEEYVFPRFEQANQLVDLVTTLKNQHNVGRKITDYILAHASQISQIKSADEIQKMALADYMRLYVRMFGPHEAREDTVLFPAFRKLLSEKEYMKLGEIFEDREQKLFGKEGFENVVRRVANIEKQLGIYKLSGFTPQLKGKH